MRIEYVLAPVLGAAFLLAAVSPLIPSGAYSQWHDALYTAAAAWILATAVYRLLKREPVWRINILGAVIILAIMAVYLTYVKIYAAPASIQIEKDLEVLEDARQTFEKHFAQTAAHTAVATSVVITVAFVIAPFTLGLSVAVVLTLIDLAIDVVNELMSMIASYFGFAYAVVSILVPLVRAAEVFPAVFVPVAATAVPSKRTIAVAAYVAAVPLLLAAAVATAPGLAPMSGMLSIEEENFVQSIAVRVNTNAPIVAEFKAAYIYYNGTHWVNSTQWWWYTVPPPGNNVTLTNGTWTLTRYIYMWVEYPVGTAFTLQNGTFVWGMTNFTSVNATYFYPLPNRTFVILVPYAWHDGWSVAASLKPNSTGISGARMNATWMFKYECYGTVSQCSGTRWDLDGLAAEYRDLVVKVLDAEYADVSYSKSAVAVAMSEDDWEKICNATESAVLAAFGARCSGWHPTKQWSTTIDVSSQPQIECRTDGNETRCEEVETWHRAAVAVSLLYVPAPTPAVAGFQRGLRSTKDVVDTIFGYAFFSLSSIFPLGGVFAPLAAKLVEPFVWIWASLIPWALRLIYTIIAVTAGTAGVLVIVGAGAPLLRILGVSQFFQMKLRAGSLEATALQLASRGLAAVGKGTAVTGGATATAAAEVAKDVVAQYKRLWALYASSVLKWTAWLWRFDPIRLAAAMWLSAYVGSKASMNIVIKAPHPRLQPAADALAKLVEAVLRQAKGAYHLVHHGSPLTPEGLAAKYSGEALDWVWATTHLRIDWMIAKLIAYLLHRVYHLSGGDMNLAVQWTAVMLLSGKPKPPRHAGDLAAFAVLFGVKTKPFPVNPENLAEGFRLFGHDYTQEQAAKLYLAHFGYDYSRLRQAWETYKDWFTQRTDISRPELFTYLPSYPQLRNVMAEFAVGRWKEGDHNALLFSQIPEFRRLAREQLGVKVTPEGKTEPVWNMWLKGAAKAAERGDIEAALRLAPGPMGQKIQHNIPLPVDPTTASRLRGAMEQIVDKAARAAGVSRDAAAAGVWKMLEDPQMRKMLKLENDYKKLEDALRQAVDGTLPKEVIEKGLPAIMQNGDVLRSIYELLKEDRIEWFERLPEHVQEQVLAKLPYGDWSYAYSAKYAGEIADITWREITPTGEVVEHRVLDHLPPAVREAVAAQRLAALDVMLLQQQAAPPAPAAADYSKYAEAMQMFGVKSYEVAEGGQVVDKQIKPEDLAAFGTPTEMRRMLAETAMFANASEKYYDEGRDYIPLEVEKEKGKEEKEMKLKEFLESQLQGIKNTALAAGLSEAEADAAAERWLKMLTSSEHADFRDKLLEFALYEDGPDAYMALLNMIEAASRHVSVKEPEAAEQLEEAVQPAPEQFTSAGEQYVPTEDRYEPVGEAAERVEAEIGKIKDEDHVEAVKRILGINFTEEEAIAYEISRTYGLPHDIAARLAEDFGEYAKEVAKEVKRVDDWLAEAGADDEFRRQYIEQNLDRIVVDADSVIRELAEEVAEKAPKELRDLVANDLAKGKFDEVNWKLSQILRYCESKGGCAPEEKRDFYTKL
ncbi:MAG: hypothetical protein ACO2PM_08315 [Pyrobaculum sp.]|jgi:hypothetical protein